MTRDFCCQYRRDITDIGIVHSDMFQGKKRKKISKSKNPSQVTSVSEERGSASEECARSRQSDSNNRESSFKYYVASPGPLRFR